ncbi:metallophosphoesterase [Mesorhizobium sp. STM 4661]|uniref:metallophosphoesterase family protein n=1 Tax=Mesorhizobium sp. STM 4661 TaxID=1297570 RepID=UPI0002BD7268|nr:metallophosphoesterase [Mesorhizobium sp. STM 4661]CCV14048.1 conserved hypothetical protein [Mesorhizobium sp. STM 4661]
MKIAIIADPHIGTQKNNFVANWEICRAHVNAANVDFTVVLGDLTLDGANLTQDCIFARQSLAALEAPVLVLPGNHDIGDVSRQGRQPVNAERIKRWQQFFGSDRWVCDRIPGWRLIGVNSQLFETGLPEEEAQWQDIAAAFEQAGARKIALFTHMPLFLEHWDEEDRPYWTILGKARRRLRALMQESGAAIVSAHIHRTLFQSRPGEPLIVWAAASSFLARDESMPPQPGAALLGVSFLTFVADSMEVRFESVPGVETTYIEDYKGSIYPPPA